MKNYFIPCLLLAIQCFAQEPSDYYDKPVQEIREKIGICWDTTVAHKAGFRQCYQEISRWITKNRVKYDFLSTAFNKDSGVVQITLLSDCRALRAGIVTEYYLVLTSTSNSLKISFENIMPHAKECMAGLRKLLKAEITKNIASLSDSVAWNAIHPNRGFGYPECTVVAPRTDSTTDSVFKAMRADSIRWADSIAHLSFRYDSIARADSIVLAKHEPPLDTPAVKKEIDSMAAVVDADSVGIYRRDCVMFKNQPVIEDRDRTVGTRLECIVFLLSHKKRSASAVAEYLADLKKFCVDKQNYYYTARQITGDTDKYECMHSFKKAQSDAAQVQALLDKLSIK